MTMHDTVPASKPEVDPSSGYIEEIRGFADQLVPTEPVDTERAAALMEKFGIEGVDGTVRANTDVIVVETADGEVIVGESYMYLGGPMNALNRHINWNVVLPDGTFQQKRITERPSGETDEGMWRTDATTENPTRFFEGMRDRLQKLAQPKPEQEMSSSASTAKPMGRAGVGSVLDRVTSWWKKK